MKDWLCDGCYKDIEVFEDYEPKGCCSGYQCGCLGKVINPVFCDECEENIYGKQGET